MPLTSQNYRVYLTTIRGRARALKKEDRTVDAVSKIIAEEMKPWYPNAMRINGTVKVAY